MNRPRRPRDLGRCQGGALEIRIVRCVPAAKLRRMRSLVRRCTFAALAFFSLLAPALRAADNTALQERADRFLSLVNASYQALYYVESEAQWKAATDVTPARPR